MARAVKYIVVLGLFLAAVSVAAGAVAARRFGGQAFAASALAAGLIWFAGSLALLIVASVHRPQLRVNAALLAMLARLALPLGAIVYFTQSRGNPFTSYGMVGLVVVHYLAGLALETWMSVRLAAAPLKVADTVGGPEPLAAR